MKLSEIKNLLKSLDKIGFQLPSGELVASHFHVTEVGKITKDFIDCGGKVRSESVINFQLWEENDYDHRLHPEKLIHIIELSDKIFKFDDLEIEVEYQGKDTISKFNLDFDGTNFLLTTKVTACLAKEVCCAPVEEVVEKGSCCSPSSGCC
ncbi:MAG: DUF6428 family protein [Polaribacter sp.]|uniref:DUF6428 family protein n=1 Tax=Polaribacter sp. TaxID=1920175 RepID=UPI003266E00E